MTTKLKNKILTTVERLKHVPNGKNKHFSFIVHRNKILSIGWNNCWKTHPIAQLCKYRFDSIHSELDAYLRYQASIQTLRDSCLINVRINRFGDIGYAAPCEKCMKWVPKIGFRKIYFSDGNGSFLSICGFRYSNSFKNKMDIF